MERSADRILTSHVGRLPDPERLHAAERAEDSLPEAVLEVVRREAEIGIDVLNDGELGKVGEWSHYVATRLSGYETRPYRSLVGREAEAFPGYFAERGRGPEPGTRERLQSQLVCTGPIEYTGDDQIRRDIANLRSALEKVDYVEAFMAAVSPDNISYQPGTNQFYGSEDEYLQANASAMSAEYRAIADAGFIVQIDMPVGKFDVLSLDLGEFRARLSGAVEALNDALRGIPRDRVRVHLCYGSWRGPHTGDLELPQIFDIVAKISAQAISFDQNVRHAHEWTYFLDRQLPDDLILMPGCVSQSTDTVEHPRLVAQRIEQYARAVGRENVIAGTDCGLGRRLPPEIAWAKLDSLATGARLASDRLW